MCYKAYRQECVVDALDPLQPNQHVNPNPSPQLSSTDSYSEENVQGLLPTPTNKSRTTS